MGLLSYPHHRPLERVNWVFPFWADARGQDALLGLPLFWGPVGGRLFSNPISCPLVLAYGLLGKGCNCSCVDCYFHVSVRINPDRRHKSSVNNNPLDFAPVFSFLTTSSISRSSGLLAFYLFGVFALCFLLDFRLFIWRRVLFWSVSFLFHSWARYVSISSCFFDWYDEVLGFSRRYPVYTVCFCDGLESLFVFAY